MGAFEIFMLIVGAIMSAAQIASGIKTNQQNKQIADEQNELARENREDVQAYNTEAAEIANQQTIEQYNLLYSPQAKVRQLDEAGLSTGLFYSGSANGSGGQAAAQAQAGAAPLASISPYINPVIAGMTNPIETMIQSRMSQKTEKEIKKIDKEVDVMDSQIEEINAKIANFEADTGLKIENTNYVKVQAITEQWKAENAKLEADFNANTMHTRKEILEKTLDNIYQQITESERRVMGMDIDQDQKTKMFGLEQARIIAETTKAQAEAARSMAEKINAEIERQILQAQQQGAQDQLAILRQQKEQAIKQTKILEEQVKQSETASKMADWEYSVRWWTKINETLGALAGVANSASNVTRAVKMPTPKQ